MQPKPKNSLFPKMQIDPLSDENLEELFGAGLQEDEVIEAVRKQYAQLPPDPENPVSNSDIQSVIEAYIMRRKK